MARQLQASFLPGSNRFHTGSMVWWGTDDLVDASRRLHLPDGAPGRTPLATPTQGHIDVVETPVRIVPLIQAVPALAAIPDGKSLSDSLSSWKAAARIVLAGAAPDRLAGLASIMPAAARAAVHEGKAWTADSLIHLFTNAVYSIYLAPTSVTEQLREAKKMDADDSLVHATLRPYQRNGLAWLRATARHQVGGILADDMGLGKTLQAIALVRERTEDRPNLVVCPTSVVGNWLRELRRFAPELHALRHHGHNRGPGNDFPPGSTVVTSYHILLRDIDQLSTVDWGVVILDEAQQIKNYQSLTARAAKQLCAQVRIALTGTPVENRLSELWSIMDFVNPGILGRHPNFHKRFAEPIEQRKDARVASRLRTEVDAFLLRRVKADVATDLPAKQESIVACTLTEEQATLYNTAIRASLDTGFGSGIQRHGRILKLLTQLKQICNHPAQYLKSTGPLHGRSGKLERATEMLTEAVAEGSQTLVFTQYRTMGELLASHLAAELDLAKIPFLHGGISQIDRDRMVDAFQTGGSQNPILIVSLKAGGVGLNLTAASNVLHYDRWWNPAVENQATDRAHRIGQTKPVDVYKLVTEGTLEDHIADLLERKKILAENIIGESENWITNMADQKLKTILALSSPGMETA